MKEEQPIKLIINELINAYKLNGKMDEMSVRNHWPEIVGTVISGKTTKLQLKGSVLTIYLDSAPLKNELNFHRSLLIQKVNTFFNKNLITEIHIK